MEPIAEELFGPIWEETAEEARILDELLPAPPHYENPYPTRRQAEILRYILLFQLVYGIAPTVREIGERFAINSPNGVKCHLRALATKGRLAWRDFTARSLAVVGIRWSPERLPAAVLAEVAAYAEAALHGA